MLWISLLHWFNRGDNVDWCSDNWLGWLSGIATFTDLHLAILITNSEGNRLTILTNDLAILIGNSRNLSTAWQNNRQFTASNRLAVLMER